MKVSILYFLFSFIVAHAWAQPKLIQAFEKEGSLSDANNFGVQIKEAYWKDSIYFITINANVLSNETHYQSIEFENGILDLRFDVSTVSGDYAYATSRVKQFKYGISGLNTKPEKLRFNGYRQGSFPKYSDSQSYLKSVATRKTRSWISQQNQQQVTWIPAPPANPIVDFPEKPALYGTAKTETESNELILNHIKEHVKYPLAARDQGVEGRVYMRFTIETDGSVKNIETVRGAHSLLDKEALRVVKTFTRFQPAQSGGLPVRTQYAVPIRFVLVD